MGHLSILTRTEIEGLGPPIPEELADVGVSEAFLGDLALRHVATLPDPNTISVAEKLCLPSVLAEELLYRLYREKLIEIRLQNGIGMTRYAMLDRGWERVERRHLQSGYVGPAPVSLDDYTYMTRLQAVPYRPATMENLRYAFRDLVLPDTLLQTLGCVVNSRSSLFLTGPSGTGKTAVSERINGAISGSIWIPYAVEVDGQVIRIFDRHCHRVVGDQPSALERDHRWVRIERPLVIVGGELTLANTDLTWSDLAGFYEAPFQMKSNCGTLVIDDFGRQQVAPQDLLNRWILPLERRVDFLTLHNGKKVEVPFEQLVVFSTNLDEKEVFDEAFLRRMAYRARLELPNADAYVEIFRRAAAERGIVAEQAYVEHLLNRYEIEERPMKACEPRDLLNRLADLCVFEQRPLRLTLDLLDVAWKNYFGTGHSFEGFRKRAAAAR